ncbi:hypothetical protein ACTFIZ_003762 [Dictyostelium cf. discoideum]
MDKVIIKKEHCQHSRFFYYFTDAKIIEGKQPNDCCDLYSYYYYLASNNVNDQYIPEYMNVGVVNVYFKQNLFTTFYFLFYSFFNLTEPSIHSRLYSKLLQYGNLEYIDIILHQ